MCTNQRLLKKVPLSDQWLVQGEIFYRLEGVDEGEEEPTDTRVLTDGSSPSDFSRSSVSTQVYEDFVAAVVGP